MNEIDLMLKDWEMTTDRIKHFNDIFIRLRIQGIPIAAAIMAAGFASIEYTRDVSWVGMSLTSLILIFGSLYLIPIFGLDLYYFKLLIIAVGHATWIEEQPQYKDKLQITTKLTSPTLTEYHTHLTFAIYLMLIFFGIFAGFTLK